MSDTPRTDMFCRTVDHTMFVGGKIYQATIETVDASFARQLEKELAEARAEIERRNNGHNLLFNTFSQLREELKEGLAERDKLIEQMIEALRLALAECRSTHCENEIRAALSAAERGE